MFPLRAGGNLSLIQYNRDSMISTRLLPSLVSIILNYDRIVLLRYKYRLLSKIFTFESESRFIDAFALEAHKFAGNLNVAESILV